MRDERETTRALALAVLRDDIETAKRLANEILGNERASSIPMEHFTDKEFCGAFKINRSTSASWRELGIVGYMKLPNGQIRYSREHIEALREKYERNATERVD